MATPLANPQQHYLKTQIETASQPQLLLMIFDAAVKKLHIAKRAIEKKEIEKAHTELTKVQRIFTELMVALDFEKGGDLAENLLRIYDFVYHHLVKANIKQDAGLIDEVLPIVEDLRDGWTKAVEKYLAETDGASAPVPAQRSVATPTLPKIPTPMPQQPIPPRPAAYKPAAVSPSAVPNDDPSKRPRLNIRG